MQAQKLQLQVINNETDYSKITVGRSKFTDDIWDLSNFITGRTIKSNQKRLDFTFIDSKDIRLTIKMYAYHKLGNVKPKTVRDKILYLGCFVKYLQINNIQSFSVITKDHFLNYVIWLKNDYNVQSQRNTGKKVANTSGYLYCQVVEEIIRLGQIKGWNVPNINIFVDMSSMELWRPQKNKDSKKTKPIPEDIFDRILYYAVNKESDILTKAGIIIQSQTGLRIAEVLSIKNGCIYKTDGGYTYLEVTVSKTEKGESVTYKVFCNELVESIVKELENATLRLREESHFQELFIAKSRQLGTINVLRDGNWGKRLNKFISKWDIRDNKGNLYPLHSHQFRATFVRELIKQKVPIAHIMKHFNHVSIEMTAHYLTLQQEEIKEIYADMILRPESKTAGLRAAQIKKTLTEQFKGKTEEEIETTIQSLAKSMSFNPLPTGVCLYDFRRGNCSNGDGCFFYNCPNYITEARFYPILKKELELMETEMARFKELGRERDWQRQYVKWKYFKPLVDSLEVQVNES